MYMIISKTRTLETNHKKFIRMITEQNKNKTTSCIQIVLLKLQWVLRHIKMGLQGE